MQDIQGVGWSEDEKQMSQMDVLFCFFKYQVAMTTWGEDVDYTVDKQTKS